MIQEASSGFRIASRGGIAWRLWPSKGTWPAKGAAKLPYCCQPGDLKIDVDAELVIGKIYDDDQGTELVPQ